MGLVDSLCQLPATDGNFTSALENATKAQIQLAVNIMKMSSNGNNKTRIEACERKLKAFDKAEPKKETAKKETPKNETPKSKGVPYSKYKNVEKKEDKELKIVEFPAPKPKIKPLLKSDENHTYEECEKKLAPTKEKHKDEDNVYVINGLLDKCKESQDFRNNFMRKEKTYDGFYDYMFKAAMAGYCVKIDGKGGMLTKEKALDLAFDYFNMEEIIKDKEKKEVAKKLTKEVNKIAEEVKETAKENVKKVEDAAKVEKNQIPGQLTFDF